MAYIQVVQRVEDYARWREGFDNNASARQAAGATDEILVMRNVDDPNVRIIGLDRPAPSQGIHAVGQFERGYAKRRGSRSA